MHLKHFLAALVSVIGLSAVAAHADPVTTLGLSATYVWNSQDYAATGTISFDPVTGALVNVNLNYGDWEGGNTSYFTSGFSLFDGSASYPTDVEEEWNLGPTQNDAPVIDLLLPVESLVGYDGGSICTISSPCETQYSTFDAALREGYFIDGTLAPTPEPSTLTLLVTGVLAMIGVGYRRFEA